MEIKKNEYHAIMHALSDMIDIHRTMSDDMRETMDYRTDAFDKRVIEARILDKLFIEYGDKFDGPNIYTKDYRHLKYLD